MRYILTFLVLVSLMSNAQDISLLQQLNGRYDYLAIGNTMNQFENGANGVCVINTESSATLTINDSSQIIAAYLYWAGSGSGDFNVMLNDIEITAERTFSDSLDATREFFAAFADVSGQIINTGTGNYTLSQLDLTDAIGPYCSSGTNFAGWAIVVVYENDVLPLNQVNIYDGLQSVPDELTITLNNLNVLDNEGAKIGFVAWEGDSALAVNESLRINGNVIGNPPLNPSTNAFNGTNSFTGNQDLYNMDIDVYDLQNNIEIGDQSAEISLTSGQDFVMINNVITVLNSQLPEATIAINAISRDCFSRVVNLNYTVFNSNSTDVLPAFTPIAFYIEDELVATSETQNNILIGGSEAYSISIMVPENSPNTATVIASVDDNGFGEGTVTESNELNNIDEAPYELLLPAIVTEALDVELCDSGQTVFLDITQQEIDVIGNQSNVEVAYYLTLEDAEASTNAILNPSDLEITESLQTIFYSVFSISDPTCAVTSSFQVSVVEPPVPVAIQDVTSCDFENVNSVAFNFSVIQMQIENDNPNAVVSFYTSLEDAEQAENAIGLNPTFQTETLPRTVYVNISNPSFENCSVIETFRVTTENCDIDVPTGFSPNGDQTNDTFTIAGLDNFYENYELRIYNRWGTLVYIGNKNTADWDGFSNQPSIGKKSLPVGTYFYWLQLDPEKTDIKVGWVYLTR